jgi:hypothetical protein
MIPVEEYKSELAPLVDELAKYKTYYIGSFDKFPVFKLCEQYIHILDYTQTQVAHHETKSLKKAKKLIIQSVKRLKEFKLAQKLKRIEDDF